MPPYVPRKRHRSPSPAPVGPSGQSTPSAKGKKPSLFETLEAPSKKPNTLQDNQAFLVELGDSDTDSSLSEVSSAEFEDVPGPSKRRKLAGVEEDEDDEDDGDEDMDWEDAMGATPTTPATPSIVPTGRGFLSENTTGDLELTLDKDFGARTLRDLQGKKKGPSKIERQIRQRTHCLHVQFLLFHNLVRNAWVCDKEVQRIVVGHLTEGMKREVLKYKRAMGFVQDGKEEKPVEKKRKKGSKGKGSARGQRDWGSRVGRMEEGKPDLSHGDPLIRLLRTLASFWKKKFQITAPGLRRQGYKAPARLEEEISSLQNDSHDPEQHGERVKSVEEFRALAKKCEGSRDVGNQLFAALLRGLEIETRMVASLQPIGFGWSKTEEADSKKKKRTKNEVQEEEESDSEDLEGGFEPEKTPRKSETRKGKGRKFLEDSRSSIYFDGDLESDNDSSPLSSVDSDLDSVIDITPIKPVTPLKKYDKDLLFPHYWVEALSPVTNTFIPVDPITLPVIATNAELISKFEPRGAKAEKAKQILAYVVAYSADGTAKDVTVRYLKKQIWPGKTKGVRIPVEKVPVYNKRGKVKRWEEYDWFKTVISGYTRDSKKRTAADDIEEERDLKPVTRVKEAKEGEGETLQGYKSSAEFVLERFLRREEALRPGAKHVRTFMAGKGANAKEEKVFLRSDVLICKTSESWHKEGREVKPREQPIKLVPMRAVTLNRKREMEEAERDGGEKLKQGLYAKEQTDWIIPPPIRNGIIPKNAFGNIDCYVPSMVPKGAVHIPLRGTAKVCRRLNINHAEAVTGFEFKSQRAVPIVEGVVVAVENEDLVLEAWAEEEEERRRKEEGKREKMALATWKKFLVGLRIVERVRDEYGGDENEETRDHINPFTNRNKKAEAARGAKPGSGHDAHLHALEDADDGHAFMQDGEDHKSDAGGSVAGGGFLAEEDEAAVGGGFIVEDSPAKVVPPVSNGALRTPISMLSAHAQGEGPDGLDSEEEGEDHEPSRSAGKVQTPSQTSALRGRPSSVKQRRVSKPKGSSTAKRSARRRSAVMPSPDAETSEEISSSPELSGDESEDDDEDFSTPARGKSLNKRNAGATGKQTPQSTESQSKRERLERRATRGVRSRYFVPPSDEEVDLEDE